MDFMASSAVDNAINKPANVQINNLSTSPPNLQKNLSIFSQGQVTDSWLVKNNPDDDAKVFASMILN
ncbi:hypothetical protein Lser_V15G28711 [Lactuca serriola]